MSPAADKVALVDYGAGNLRSVENALRAAGAGNVIVTADPAAVLAADRIILPGVGAFAQCIGALTALPGMVAALDEAVNARGRPFLGICVGMQLLATTGHEHGEHRGLGWIAGDVVRLTPADTRLKVPHMGWNAVSPRPGAALVTPGEAYFVHSYRFDPADPDHRLAETDHGGAIAAAVGRDNIIGVQFHPEKSQSYGLSLLTRFLDWRP
jgi:glutamine amidotransferase